MAIFFCQPVVVISLFLCTLLAPCIDSADNQLRQKSGYPRNRAKDSGPNNEKTVPESSDPTTNNVSRETLEQARRTLSQLSPEARRFLFSPTIQNTITNLNQNTNTQGIRNEDGGEGNSEPAQPGAQRSQQLLGYVNPDSGGVEYDLKGKVDKICFILK